MANPSPILPTDNSGGITPGKLEGGSFGVTPDGAATYTLPLWVPVGRRNIEPELALHYNSRGGNGLLGVGWSLTGIPRITRRRRTIADEGVEGPIRFDKDDPFALDGEPLVLVAGIHGVNGAEYRTKRDTFTKIILRDVNSAPDGHILGPTWFEAFHKDGRIFTFGGIGAGDLGSRFEGMAQELIPVPVPPTTPDRQAQQSVAISNLMVRYAWGLQSVRDRSDNMLIVYYEGYPFAPGAPPLPRDFIPTRIEYTGSPIDGTPALRSVNFIWEDRPDLETRLVSGLRVTQNKRLAELRMSGPDPTSADPSNVALLQRYAFAYKTPSVSGRSLLASVQELDGAGIAKGAHTFDWELGQTSFREIATGVTDIKTTPIGRSLSPGRIRVADFDGDGRDDILYIPLTDPDHFYILRSDPSSPTGFLAPYNTKIPVPANVENGRVYVYPDPAGDFMNIFVLDDSALPGTPGSPTYRVYHAGIDRSGASGSIGSFWVFPGRPIFDPSGSVEGPVEVVDLDGDGLPDLLHGYTGGGGPEPVWYMRANQGGNLNFDNEQLIGVYPFDHLAASLDGGSATGLLVDASGTTGGDPRYSVLRVKRQGANVTTTVTLGTLLRDQQYVFGDFTGSGLPSAFSLGNAALSDPTLAENLGGSFGMPSPFVMNLEQPPGQFTPSLRVFDWNQDGHATLLARTRTAVQLNDPMFVFRWDGAGFTPTQLPFTSSWDLQFPAQFDVFEVMDCDGNGLDDVVMFSNGQLRVFVREGNRADMLTSIVDGLGARTSITYAPISDPAVHTPTYGYTFPQRAMTGKVWVVSEYRDDNGIGGVNTHRYTYQGGIEDVTGLGFLGFHGRTSVHVETGITTTSTYLPEFVGYQGIYPLLGLPIAEVTTTPLGNGQEHVATTHTTYAVRPGGSDTRPFSHLAAVSRNPDQLDLFAVGQDGGVYTAWWNSAGGWQPAAGWALLFSDTRPFSHLAAVSRNPDQLDLFAVGQDGGVYTAWWNSAGGWQPAAGWALLFSDTRPFSHLAAVSRNPDQLDLFAVGQDGGVYTAWWNSAGGWQPAAGWALLFSDTRPFSHLAAVSRNPDQLDLFAVGQDGGVYTAWWNSAGGWQPAAGWALLFSDTRPFSHLAAVSRNPDQLDLFAVGQDGGVYTAWWNSAGGWQPAAGWALLFSDTRPFSHLAAVSRNPDQLDLFAVGQDGGVYTAWWNSAGGWQPAAGWALLFSDTRPFSHLAAVSRNPDQLDLFAVGQDGGVYTAWWNSAGGWQPAAGWALLFSDTRHLAAPFFVFPLSTVEEQVVNANGVPTTPVRRRTTTQDMDAFANVITYAEVWSDGNKQTTTSAYSNNPATWLIGLLTDITEQSTAPSGVTQTRKRAYEYDAQGLVSREIIEPGPKGPTGYLPLGPQPDGVKTLYRTFDRYSNGNLYRTILEESMGPTGEKRSTTVVYDDLEHLFPVDISDDLSHRVRATYHPGLAVQTSYTEPDGTQTFRQYDGFGRLRDQLAADGSHFSAHYLAAAGKLLITLIAGSGEQVTYTHDVLGRIVAETRIDRDDGAGALREIEYDAFGRAHRMSRPHFAADPPAYTVFAYDALGRITSRVGANGTSATYEYRGEWVITTDGESNAVAMRTDNLERPVFVTDRDAALVGSGTPSGMAIACGPFNVTATVTDIAGNVSKRSSDRLGRPIEIVDPDRGHLTYSYNAFGDPVQDTRGSGQIVTYEYDPVGRLAAIRDASDGDVTFTWDTAATGKVAQIAAPASGITTAFTYDAAGRPVTKHWTIGTDSYSLTRVFDSAGRLAGLTYPAVGTLPAFTLQYEYGKFGQLLRAKDGATNDIYWRWVSSDATGRFGDDELGNGLVDRWIEDDARPGVLKSIQTLDKHEHMLRDTIYGFDANLNLTRRDDKVLNTEEAFTYDAFKRLKHWTWHGSAGSRRVRWDYDDIGNLQLRAIEAGPGADLSYTYNAAIAGPHAVIATTLGAYTYDARGNQTSAPGRVVTFGRGDLPTKIVETGKSSKAIDFLYDGEGARVRTIDQQTGLTADTLDRLYEFRRPTGTAAPDGDHVFVIMVRGRLVARRTWGVAKHKRVADRVEYLHADHQQSIELATSSHGRVLERLKYEPYGRRADINDPAKPHQERNVELHTGYTGHEHLDGHHLIDMRGRVYDPIIAKFLSADPTVSNPLNPQAWNRYAYVLDNPLSLRDPTGFKKKDDDDDPDGDEVVVKGATTRITFGTGSTVIGQGPGPWWLGNGQTEQATPGETSGSGPAQSGLPPNAGVAASSAPAPTAASKPQQTPPPPPPPPKNDDGQGGAAQSGLPPNAGVAQGDRGRANKPDRDPAELLLRLDRERAAAYQSHGAPFADPARAKFEIYFFGALDVLLATPLVLNGLWVYSGYAVAEGGGALVLSAKPWASVMAFLAALGPNLHHVQPTEFVDEFEAAGINAQLFTIRIPHLLHVWLHLEWNPLWEQFFGERGGSATAEEIAEFSGFLMERYGLWGFGWHVYPRMFTGR